MQRIAVELGLDPLDVIRRNLIPADAFPYRTATGAIYDSGDYGRRSTAPSATARWTSSSAAATRPARKAGSMASASPPSSSPACRTWATSLPSSRPPNARKAGPKNGAQATATHHPRPGRLGHGASGVDAARAGPPDRACAGRRRRASAFDRRPCACDDRSRHRQGRLVDRLGQLFEPLRAGGGRGRRISPRPGCATSSPASPPRSSMCGPRTWFSPAARSGRARNPEAAIAVSRASRRRAIGRRALLPEADDRRDPRDRVLDAAGADARRPTTTRSTPRCATASSSISAASRSTARPARCASTAMSPCTIAGACCIPAWSTGQIRGGFAQALGRGLLEELSYGEDGAFLSGTFADYLLPTATEVPDIEILHIETPVALHAARRQGRRRGQLHVDAGLPRQCGRGRARRRDIDLPLTPAKLRSSCSRGDGAVPPEGAVMPRQGRQAGRPRPCAAIGRGASAGRARKRSGRCCSTLTCSPRSSPAAMASASCRDDALRGRRHARRRSGEGSLQGGGAAVRPRPAATRRR